MAGNRPGPLLLWPYYAFGGRLPRRYAQWVLHDLTGRYWLLRHQIRTFVQTLPAWLFLLLPGPLSLTALLPVFVILGAEYMAFSFADEMRDHRLYQHGFAPDMVLPRRDHGRDRNEDGGG
ncbi:MAG TPA: DUF5313 family protein [Pseudonocardiaceae bacterium]|nr:DUF5313 family protein [Pseudonocardiaceae bacterium]